MACLASILVTAPPPHKTPVPRGFAFPKSFSLTIPPFKPPQSVCSAIAGSDSTNQAILKHSPNTTSTLLPKFIDSIVHLDVTCVETDPSRPYRIMDEVHQMGTGFVIDGRLILTNSHNIEGAVQILVYTNSGTIPFLARVVARGHECDMALLAIDDAAEFWDKAIPITFSGSSYVGDTVSVVGFPCGNKRICVTKGIISRVDMLPYKPVTRPLFVLQTDAPVNDGNSGGPVFDEHNHCVGMIFAGSDPDKRENVAYLIPTDIVRHFLEDVERNKKFTGFPRLEIYTQDMVNPYMREFRNLERHQTGVLIANITAGSSGSEVLRRGDVILAIDGVRVGNDGSVPCDYGGRLHFSYLVSRKFWGDSCAIEVHRTMDDNTTRIITQEVVLKSLSSPEQEMFESTPQRYFFLVAGVVFTLDHSTQLAKVSRIFDTGVTIGYQDLVESKVVLYNDMVINNFFQLFYMVRELKDPHHLFFFNDGQFLSLPRESADKAMADVMRRHNIASSCSPVLSSMTKT